MKRFVTDQDEIYQLILADPAFTEAVHRDKKGVYIVGGDGSRRYITKLEMADGPLPDSEYPGHLTPHPQENGDEN